MSMNYKNAHSIKSVNIYTYNKLVSDLLDLKNNKSIWKKIKTTSIEFNKELNPSNPSLIKIKFPITVVAKNLMIEFSMQSVKTLNKFENRDNIILCNNCGVVEDKFGTGICLNCRDSGAPREKECPNCRNISYERYFFIDNTYFP